MKITPEAIKHFEEEQKRYSTEVALHNVIWQIAAELLRDLGVKSIETSAS